MDILNRAMDQARQLQQTAAAAVGKGMEAAQPLVADAVKRAQDLQRSIVEQTPHVTAAAQTQYNAALQHAGTVIATGKSMLEAGTAGAQQHLQTFAEQARKTADSTASAVNAARQGGQASGDKGPGAGSGGTGSGSGTGTGSGGSSGRPPDATEAGGGGDVAEGEGNVPGSAAGTGSSDGT